MASTKDIQPIQLSFKVVGAAAFREFILFVDFHCLILLTGIYAGLLCSRSINLSLLLTPSGAETLVFWVSQPLPWLVAPKSVPLMTRRGDLKLSHGATAKARENAVKQDRVPTTNAIKSP